MAERIKQYIEERLGNAKESIVRRRSIKTYTLEEFAEIMKNNGNISHTIVVKPKINKKFDLLGTNLPGWNIPTRVHSGEQYLTELEGVLLNRGMVRFNEIHASFDENSKEDPSLLAIRGMLTSMDRGLRLLSVLPNANIVLARGRDLFPINEDSVEEIKETLGIEGVLPF